MPAHSTTYMNNGHTLTVTQEPDASKFFVIERDATGSLVHIYPCDTLEQANAMVEERAPMPTASERIRAAREQRDGEPDAAGLAVVVFDVERDGAPMPLGLFIRHDEDVVIYENSRGEYAQAPYDCVKVKRVRL